MKEINIYIEGFNVNGICVGCLNYKRKMYYSKIIRECYGIIANIDVPDGLDIQLCWECMAAVQYVMRFQKRVLRSFDVLINYSKEHTFLNSPEDFTKHASSNLSRTPIEAYNLSFVKNEQADGKSDDQEMKDEDDAFNFDVESVKDEPDFPEDHFTEIFTSQDQDLTNEVKDEPENGNNRFSEEFPPQDQDLTTEVKDEPEIGNNRFSEEFPSQDLTSEDDMQLSELKRKREKREKKRGKKKKEKDKSHHKAKYDEKEHKIEEKPNRKLKNLPADLVELYQMEEEEMWTVRVEDVAHKDFQRLKYKCNDCVLKFHTEKLMTDHFKGKHRPKGEDSHQCDVCKAYFLTKDNLSAHRSLHLWAYRCRECGFRTILKRLMMKHVTTHKHEHQYLFQCVTCGCRFTTKSKLTYHRGICHQEKPQCDCCGKVFANKMTLKYHLKILPLNKEQKPQEKLYIPCKGCNKVFHSKKSYRAHVVIHEGVTYPCPTCGKLFQWKRNLARHARNHRDREAGALHHCADCGKTFASRDCYHNHLRLSKRHAAQDSYAHECNYCGKKFPTKWCMVDHIDWDHLKRIKYQCSVCFKAFKTAKIMVAHVNNIHEGKKREQEGEHLCDICGKSYKTVKRLKGHVWAMHTKRSTTKSFKCKLCPATFTWQTSIYKHMKMMHDTSKRMKQPRPLPLPLKKEDPYPGIELANRMQYFQQNIANNLAQNIVQSVQVQQPISVMQNIV